MNKFCLFIYLGENDKYEIHTPGATHCGRWLMKLLYSIKIVIFKNNLLASTMRKGHSKLINRFIIF